METIETREIENTYLLLNSEIKILRLKNEDPSSLISYVSKKMSIKGYIKYIHLI